jgi:transcriptional regulator with XRE-family HTH domain
VRRARRLSQRGLAGAAGIPPTTVDRIESGRTTRPSLRLIEDILAATGYRLVVVDRFGRPFELDEVHGRLRDRSGRQFPAHLEVRRLNWSDRWWGWSRVAYWPGDDVPEWTYDRRSPNRFDVLWDDAT